MNRLGHHQGRDCTPLFAEARGDIAVSFEFFPPKTEKMEATLWESVKTLEPLAPRFVSVTYGAGGSTRERTHATVARIVRETSIPAAAHLTCVSATREEIDAIARAYWDVGRAPHRRAARRSARAGRQIRAASGRLPQRGRTGRRPQAAWRRSRFRSPPIPNATRNRRASPPISTISSARSTPAPTARSPNSSSIPNASSASATRSRRPGSTSRSCPASCR